MNINMIRFNYKILNNNMNESDNKEFNGIYRKILL